MLDFVSVSVIHQTQLPIEDVSVVGVYTRTLVGEYICIYRMPGGAIVGDSGSLMLLCSCSMCDVKRSSVIESLPLVCLILQKRSRPYPASDCNSWVTQGGPKVGLHLVGTHFTFFLNILLHLYVFVTIIFVQYCLCTFI